LTSTFSETAPDQTEKLPLPSSKIVGGVCAEDDMLVYYCGFTEKPVEVVVPLHDKEVMESESVTLTCELNKHNKPVTWCKDDAQLTIDGKHYKYGQYEYMYFVGPGRQGLLGELMNGACSFGLFSWGCLVLQFCLCTLQLSGPYWITCMLPLFHLLTF
jgi:hypothetical protein